LAADVYLVKSVTPPTAFAGDAITYTLAFSNAGNATASGVVITDWLPAEVNLTGCEPCGFVENLSGLVWQIQDLAPGETGALTITG
jgi:uncharacterized repeat protein (TIGR01451 family)